MLVEEKLKKVFTDLMCEKGNMQVFLNEQDITVSVFDNSSKLVLTTPVYFGGGYIPKSVRVGVSKTPPFDKNQTIRTTLSIDEENFRVFLKFVGTTETLNSERFVHLMEDFCYLAEEWRIYLDEHDKKDLVYVRI